MFVATTQVWKPGSFTSAAGSPNFLRDISNLVTNAQWSDVQVGGLADATFQMVLGYEDTTDLTGGNWITFGCLGGVLNNPVSAGGSSIIVGDATDDLGNKHLYVGDPIVITNGVNSELFLVSAISWSGSTATITLGAAPGPNVSTLLNAYSAGATVARLVYQGILSGRKRTTALSNTYALTAKGMVWRYQKAMSSFDIEQKDSAASILQLMQMYATTVPEVIVNSANFVATNGIMYTGTSNSLVPVMQIVTDILRTESGGATSQAPNEATFWAFWVDALRQAHHQQVHTSLSPLAPTYTLDIQSGNAFGDVAAPLEPTDMDLSQLINTALVTGGADSSGNPLAIVLTNSSSIAQWGHYEGTLSNANITDKDQLALWASGQIGVLGWPRSTGRLNLIVASLRLTARDQIEITGFDDSSTLVTNPVEVRYTVSMKQRQATAMVTLTQQNPDVGSIMREIAKTHAMRSLQVVPGVRLADAYVVSGGTVTTNALTYTVAPAVVMYGGVSYSIPQYSATMPVNGVVQIGAQVGGTAPTGFTLPCFCPMPNVTGISNLYAQDVYDFGATGMVKQTNFVGVGIANITSLNSAIVAVRDLRVVGGVNGSNLVPIPAGTSGSPTLGTASVNPEGSASAAATLPVTLPSAWVNTSWLDHINVLVSVAGANAWSVASQLRNITSASQTITVHGLAAGQGYDVALEPVPFNSTPGSVYLLGTSPTVQSSAVTAAILEYTEFPGGKLQSDGSITNVDGAVTHKVLPGGSGFTFHAEADIAVGSTALYSELRINDAATMNGYAVRFWGTGNPNALTIYQVVSGTYTALAQVAAPTLDTLPHHLQITVLDANANIIEASVDMTTLQTNGSLGPINSAVCQVGTGGSPGSIRGFSFSSGNRHYSDLPIAIRDVINSSGQIPASTPFNAQGSIPPFTTTAIVEVNSPSGATYITVFVDNGSPGGIPIFYRSDGTTITAPTLSFSSLTTITPSSFPTSVQTNSNGVRFTGLSTGVTYVFLVYYNVNTGYWTIAIKNSPFVASEIIVPYQDSYAVLLAAQSIGSFSSGGGGGSTGGCPAVGQIIETKERGFVKAETLRKGEHLRDWTGGWNEVLNDPGTREAQIWEVCFNTETIRVDASHMFDTTGEGRWVNVKDLISGDFLPAYPPGSGQVRVESVKCCGMGEFVYILCERSRYVLGHTISHNVHMKN